MCKIIVKEEKSMRAKMILFTSLLLLIFSTTVGTAAVVNQEDVQTISNEPCLALFLHVDDVLK